jgi:hypothetical protein
LEIFLRTLARSDLALANCSGHGVLTGKIESIGGKSFQRVFRVFPVLKIHGQPLAHGQISSLSFQKMTNLK